MGTLQRIGVAIGLAMLTACGGGETQNEVNATDLNSSLETIEVDNGLNSTDPLLDNLADQNLGADINADVSANVVNDTATSSLTNTAE